MPGHSDFEPPARPVFYQYTPAQWFEIPVFARDAISADDLACKRYIASTEQRADIHNRIQGGRK